MFETLDAESAPAIAAFTEETATKSIFARDHRPLLVGVLAILVLVVPFFPAYETRAAPMDEGSLLLYPELIQKGKLPYRDFETFYGPANAYVLALTYSVFGDDIIVERTVGLLYRALILSLIFALIARWHLVSATGCTALAGWILLGARIVAYAWFGGIVLLLGSILLLVNAKSNARLLCAGVLAGCALLYRTDLAPAIIVSALPFFGLIEPGRWIRYLVGLTAGLLPLAILTCLVGAHEIINNLFLYPVFYGNPARHLPMATVEPYVFSVFVAHVLAVAFNIFAGILAIRAQPRETRSRLLLALALVGAALTPQAAQRLDIIHLTCAAFISISIVPLSLLTVFFRKPQWQPRSVHMALASVAVLAALEAVAPEVAAYFKQETKVVFIPGDDGSRFAQHRGRSFPCGSELEAHTIMQMLDRLERESLPGERLFVGPGDLRRTSYCDTFIYYLIPRLPPSGYFLEMNPLPANRQGSRLAHDAGSADWLVLNCVLDARAGEKSIERVSVGRAERCCSRSIQAGGTIREFRALATKKLGPLGRERGAGWRSSSSNLSHAWA